MNQLASEKEVNTRNFTGKLRRGHEKNIFPHTDIFHRCLGCFAMSASMVSVPKDIQYPVYEK